MLLLLEGLYCTGMEKKITLGCSNLVANYYTKRGNFPATNGRACYQQMYTTESKIVIAVSV